MFVRDCMSAPAVTVTPDTPFQTAAKMLREHQFRRLPVVDKNGRLAGIVAERDLLHATPSPAESLSSWERNHLLAQLTVQQVMTRAIIITTPDTLVEHAASLMIANRIGGLPVVDEDNQVVGVITETDIFKAFVEMMDGKEGVRLTLDLPEEEVVPLAFLQAIYTLGGRLAALGSIPQPEGSRRVVLRLRDVSAAQLADAFALLGDRLVDVYEPGASALQFFPPFIQQNGCEARVLP